MLNALVGSSGGQNNDILLMPYNTMGKSIARYAVPIWSANASYSSFKKIQTAQNAALMTATGAHKMGSIDHPHQESLTLTVRDHSGMHSAQYIVNCLEENHVCHDTTTPRARTQNHEGDSTLDITQLFFLDSAQAGRKTFRTCTYTR